VAQEVCTDGGQGAESMPDCCLPEHLLGALWAMGARTLKVVSCFNLQYSGKKERNRMTERLACLVAGGAGKAMSTPDVLPVTSQPLSRPPPPTRLGTLRPLGPSPALQVLSVARAALHSVAVHPHVAALRDSALSAAFAVGSLLMGASRRGAGALVHACTF
jgi:hypothetical protein